MCRSAFGCRAHALLLFSALTLAAQIRAPGTHVALPVTRSNESVTVENNKPPETESQNAHIATSQLEINKQSRVPPAGSGTRLSFDENKAIDFSSNDTNAMNPTNESAVQLSTGGESNVEFENESHSTVRETKEQNAESNSKAEHQKGEDQKPSKERERDSQLAYVSGLMSQNSELRQKLLSNRLERDEAAEELQDSIGRKKLLEAETEDIATLRHKIELKLNKLREQIPRYDETIEVLKQQMRSALRKIRHLRERSYILLREKRKFDSALRERGLEQWVQQSVKDSVSPFVSDALVQGTATVVEPVLDGIEKLAAVNQDFTKKMSVTLRGHVPIVEKPFYSGFVTYMVLLFPTVLITSVMLKIKRGFAKLTRGHLLVILNCYFLLLSGGCFFATVFGSVDVLLTFRHHNLRLFDFVLVLHGLLFTFHVLLHASVAMETKSGEALLHSVLLTAVGVHFFVHSYSHAMHSEDPDVDKGAYLIYLLVFFFVLYELTVKQIRHSQDKKVMTLNNASISVLEKAASATGAVNIASESKWRLPSTRANFVKNQTTPLDVSLSVPGLHSPERNSSNNMQQVLDLERAGGPGSTQSAQSGKHI